MEGADEEDEPGVISLTAQGRAMLRHLDTAGAGKAELVEIVLEPSDPFAHPLVLLKLSELGPGLLVDAYCRAEQLRDLLQFEGISRVLMSARDSNQLQAVSIMLGRVENPGLEVRQSTAIHDRYFIPDAGPVLMLGMSLNGVGKKVGAITQLGDDASEVIRKTHEEFWAESLAVEPASTGGPSRGSGSSQMRV